MDTKRTLTEKDNTATPEISGYIIKNEVVPPKRSLDNIHPQGRAKREKPTWCGNGDEHKCSKDEFCYNLHCWDCKDLCAIDGNSFNSFYTNSHKSTQVLTA